MNGPALEELRDLTVMLYRAEEAQMRDLNEREAKLRRALATLEDTRKSAQALPADALGPMRRVGGDVLWLGWSGRQRAELNRQLALCLAQKARRMERLRRAHGKKEAATGLLERDRAAARAKVAARQFAQLDAMMLARGSRR